MFTFPEECDVLSSEIVVCNKVAMTTSCVKESIIQNENELIQSCKNESSVKQECDFDSNENAFCGQVDCIKEECDLSDCSVDESMTNECSIAASNVICKSETATTEVKFV